MKTISKVLLILLTQFLLVSGANASVMAVDSGDVANIRNNSVDLTKKVTDCSRYKDTKLTERIIEYSERINVASGDRLTRLVAKRSEWDNKLTESRTELDNRRNEYFESLKKLAQTQSQRDAVQVFIEEVEESVAISREELDKSKAFYRSEVDIVLKRQNDDIAYASEKMKNSITYAYAKAVSSCENNTPEKDVKVALKEDIAQAQEIYKESREEIADSKEELAILSQTRKEDIAGSKATFREYVNIAKTALDDAFSDAN